jgi:hypothetical protein
MKVTRNFFHFIFFALLFWGQTPLAQQKCSDLLKVRQLSLIDILRQFDQSRFDLQIDVQKLEDKYNPESLRAWQFFARAKSKKLFQDVSNFKGELNLDYFLLNIYKEFHPRKWAQFLANKSSMDHNVYDLARLSLLREGVFSLIEANEVTLSSPTRLKRLYTMVYKSLINPLIIADPYTWSKLGSDLARKLLENGYDSLTVQEQNEVRKQGFVYQTALIGRSLLILATAAYSITTAIDTHYARIEENNAAFQQNMTQLDQFGQSFQSIDKSAVTNLVLNIQVNLMVETFKERFQREPNTQEMLLIQRAIQDAFSNTQSDGE